MILLDNDMGVRIVRANGMATIQVLDQEKCWVDFYKLKWDDLAQGKVMAETLGTDRVDGLRMVRCVALAAACAAREDIAQGFGSRT